MTDLKTEIASIQNQLRDLMARATDVNSKESQAIMNANAWLSDITNPMTDAERAEWDESVETFMEAERDADWKDTRWILEDRTNDATRREWLEGLTEDADA